MWFSQDILNKIGQGSSENIEQALNEIKSQINQLPHVQKISEIRKKYHLKSYREVFGKFRLWPNFAFTYHQGGRNELQANIGIRQDGIRLGYSFYLDISMFSDTFKIDSFLNATITSLHNCESATYKVWESLSPVYTEVWMSRECCLRGFFKFERFCAFLEKSSSFVFFGSFLALEENAGVPSILDHSKSLQFIDKFFELTLPFFDEAHSISYIAQKNDPFQYYHADGWHRP